VTVRHPLPVILVFAACASSQQALSTLVWNTQLRSRTATSIRSSCPARIPSRNSGIGIQALSCFVA